LFSHYLPRENAFSPLSPFATAAAAATGASDVGVERVLYVECAIHCTVCVCVCVYFLPSSPWEHADSEISLLRLIKGKEDGVNEAVNELLISLTLFSLSLCLSPSLPLPLPLPLPLSLVSFKKCPEMNMLKKVFSHYHLSNNTESSLFDQRSQAGQHPLRRARSRAHIRPGLGLRLQQEEASCQRRNPRLHGPRGAQQGHRLRLQRRLVQLRLHAL